MIYAETGNFAIAQEKYNQAIHIAERIGDNSKKAGIVSNIASILTAQKQFDEAKSLIRQAFGSGIENWGSYFNFDILKQPRSTR